MLNKKLIALLMTLVLTLCLAPTVAAVTPNAVDVTTVEQPADKALVQETSFDFPGQNTIFTVTYALDGGAMIAESVASGGSPQRTPLVPDTTRTFVGWKDASGNSIVPAEFVISKDETFTASYAVKLNTTAHTKYVSGMPTGLFKPEDPLTRGEACQLLYNLMTETDEITVDFADVAESIWYYKPVSVMASMGLIYGDGSGNFRPVGYITRAEFVVILSRFYPIVEGTLAFSDVAGDHWAAKAVASAEEKGWITLSNDELFRPNDAITRAEAVAITNRVLQRSASREVIDAGANLRIFPDVPQDYWAYYDIMEAAVDHQYSKTSGTEVWSAYTEETADIKPGFQLIDGQLYYENEDGYFIHDTTVGTFTFDRLGRSTTGNAELDAYITEAVLKVTNPGMTQLEMLRAVHDYTRDKFTYVIRNYYETGETGWVEKEGLIMFQTGRGNCYCFTSVFYFLSRRLGYDAIAISGEVGDKHSPHGWVEIVFDNENFIFDADIERAYMRNGVPRFNLFYLSYDNVPWPYFKLAQ